MAYVAIVGVTVVVIALLSWVILGGGGGPSGGTMDPKPTSRGSGGSKEKTTSQKNRNWLVGKSGEVEGKTYHVGGKTVTIGRKPTNFIQIGDAEVSRNHAQLRPAGVRVALVDMNSSTGTYLNGHKLKPNEPQTLEDGDTFKIAGVSFEYELTGDHTRDYGQSSLKSTGRKFESSTKKTGGAEWRDTVLQQLREADGDPEAAAEEMGIDTEVFVQMMEQANVSPEDV